MSYFRYITGVYKSYLPGLNRTLRSSSVPRTVPELDTKRYVRSSSVPPSYFDPNFCRPSTHFNDRAKRAVSVRLQDSTERQCSPPLLMEATIQTLSARLSTTRAAWTETLPLGATSARPGLNANVLLPVK